MILSGKRLNRVSLSEESSLPNLTPTEQGTQVTVEVSEVHEILQWTSEIITTLFRLSVVIRNAITRDRYAKAVGSYPAFVDIAKVDLTHVASKFPRIGKDEKAQWFVQRLGNAITQRRQFLYYQRRHHKAMGQNPFNESDGQELAGRSNTPLDRTLYKAEDDQVDSAESRGPATTTASTLDAAKLDKLAGAGQEPQDETDGMSSHATSISTNDGNAGRVIVPLVDLKVNGLHFECPYCRDIQDIRMEHSWRYATYSGHMLKYLS